MPAALRPLLLVAFAALGVCAFSAYGGLSGRRREWGAAWLLAVAVATVILLPALLVPHGIPSPSATLSRLAPWQTAADAATSPSRVVGNPELGDVTFQIEPWLLFLRTELRAGRLPFWNPHQSSGTPYWSNGQSAPLFPLHLLFVVLPVELGFVLLPWLRVLVGALGAYFLARNLGVGIAGSRLAAVVYPLSGRLVSFLLFPMANALCLVPWLFLAVERLAAGKRAWTLLATLAALQLLAGHPETAFFTAVACGIYLLVRGSDLRAQTITLAGVWARVVSAWIVGLLLSGVALVPLALTLRETERWQQWTSGGAMGLATMLSLWLRFVLPNAYGQAMDGSFWGPFLFVPTTVYAGALTLPFAGAALFLRGRSNPLDRRLKAIAVMSVVCLLASYHFPGVRELLLATPVVQRMLHHYLLLGVELGLALLAGAGLEVWLAGEGRGLLPGALLPLVAVAAGWAAFHDDWSARGQVTLELGATLLAAGLPLLLVASLRWRADARRRWASLVVAVALADLAWAHAGINPVLPVHELYSRTPAIDFLASRQERVAAVGTALRPNAAMVYGLFDVRGDDALKLSRYERVYGNQLAEPHPTYFRPIANWRSAELDRLGVRWVLASPGAASPVAEWRRAYSGDDATVFERTTAQPLVRFDGASPAASPPISKRVPGRWEIAWPGATNPGSPRLVVAETWDAGWRATLDGRALAVETVDELWLGVRPGDAPGRLVLSYVPAGFANGLLMSGIGLVLLALGAWRFRPEGADRQLEWLQASRYSDDSDHSGKT